MKAESTISDICYFPNILRMLQKSLWLKIRNFLIRLEGQKYNFRCMLFPRWGQDQIITHNIEKLYVWVYPILMPHTRLREHVVVPETVQCKNWFRHIMVNYWDCPQRTHGKLPKYPGDVVECDRTEHILVNRVPGIIRYKNHVKALHSFYYHFGALYTWWSFSLFGHDAFLKGLFSTPNLMRNFL